MFGSIVCVVSLSDIGVDGVIGIVTVFDFMSCLALLYRIVSCCIACNYAVLYACMV